jgi:hypothetical protein
LVDLALTAYVYIDDRVAAGLARLLIASLGSLADRKLTEVRSGARAARAD